MPPLVTDGPLYGAVTDLVDRLKPHGLSREVVVSAVASLVREPDDREHAPSLRPRPIVARATALGDHLPAWCARAYAGDEWW